MFTTLPVSSNLQSFINAYTNKTVMSTGIEGTFLLLRLCSIRRTKLQTGCDFFEKTKLKYLCILNKARPLHVGLKIENETEFDNDSHLCDVTGNLILSVASFFVSLVDKYLFFYFKYIARDIQ